MTKGMQFLSDSNTQRENEEYLKSLISSDEALLAFQEENNLEKMAECFAARALTFRLLYRKTKDKSFLVLLNTSIATSVELARFSGIKTALALPLFGLAKAQAETGEYTKAITTYKEAIKNIVNNPPESHDHPAVRFDMETHLAVSEYKAGDKTAVDRLKEALTNLENADHPSYEKNVWVSGAYMRLAELLDSREHLFKAKEIIDSDPRLSIRLKQWTELSSKLK